MFADGRPRIVNIKGIRMDAEFGPSMIYITNLDKPGFIGKFSSTLGDAGINIATFHVGREAPGGNADRADRDRRRAAAGRARQGAGAAAGAVGAAAEVLRPPKRGSYRWASSFLRISSAQRWSSFCRACCALSNSLGLIEIATMAVPLKALDVLLDVAMAIWERDRAKKEREEQEKQRTIEAVFKQGAAAIEKGMQAIVNSAATVQGFMDTWERNARNPGFHYARVRAVVEVQSYVGIVSARAEKIHSMTTYRIVSLNVKAVAGYRDFEIEDNGEEQEVEKTDEEKLALIKKGHWNPDLFRKTVRNRSLGYTIVPPLHTPFDVVVTKIGNLFVDVTNVITEVAGTGSLWLEEFNGFNFKNDWKEQFNVEPQFNAPLDPAVCEFCLRYLFASAKVLSRHALEQQDLEGNLEDPRKGYKRRFELLQSRVDHDRAPYNKNFSDFVRQVGRLVKSGRADADVAAAVEELQLGARSIWNDLRRIEDNIKNPEYYYLGPSYKPEQ